MNVFTLLIVPVICFNFIYLWMRRELKKLGKEYPLFNSSFTIYAEFMYRASSDSNLKRKYNKVLVSSIVISVFYILICFLVLS